jgi:hypothetical protein
LNEPTLPGAAYPHSYMRNAIADSTVASKTLIEQLLFINDCHRIKK